MVKLNTDENIKMSPGKGGIGGVFKNHDGEWLLGFHANVAYTNPIEAELKAIKRGLQLATQYDFKYLEIELDATKALAYIVTGTPLYDNIIFDCRLLLSGIARWVLHQVYRE